MPPGVELAADNQERMTLEAEHLTKHTIQNTKKNTATRILVAASPTWSTHTYVVHCSSTWIHLTQSEELLNELRSLQISDKAFQDVLKLPTLEAHWKSRLEL